MITVQIPGIGIYKEGLVEAQLFTISFRLGEPGNRIQLENVGPVDQPFQNTLSTAKTVAEKIAGKRFEHDIIFGWSRSPELSGGSHGLMAALAMLSLLTNKPLKPGVSGTGQIDQAGNVYPAANMLAKAESATKGGATVFIMAHDPDQATPLPRGMNYYIVSSVDSAWKMVSE